MKKILALLLVLMMIFSFAACSSDSDDADSSEPTKKADVADKDSTDKEADADKDEEADKEADSDKEDAEKSDDKAEVSGDWVDIGKTVELEGVDYTVSAVLKDSGGEMPAADGNTYLMVDMLLTNKTDEVASVSSLLMFELQDGQDNVYDLSIGGLVALDQYSIVQADGDIPAKSEFNCGVAFEIPEDTKGLKLVIKSFMTDETVEIPLE
jgi:hypothetical protein